MSLGNLDGLYGAQDSPFSIFHHHDNFYTIHPWLCVVPMISIILVIIEHNLIKCSKYVIGTILII
jgi:hypothetical protein